MSGKDGMAQDGGNLHSNDRNYIARMRLLNQAHRDAVARLRDGHNLAAVLWELRDAYRLAEQARPIVSYHQRGEAAAEAMARSRGAR